MRSSLALSAAAGLGLCLGLAAPAAAKCSAGTVEVWPPVEAPLPPNGRVVVRATGASRAQLQGLALRGPRLVSQNDKVPLRVLQRNDGEFSVSQVVLEPEAPLRPGTSYRLELPGVEAQAAWTTSAGPDQYAPRWSGPPSVLASQRQEMGCGPSSSVTIRVPASDDRNLMLLEAQVRRRGSAASPVRFLVEVREGTAAIGHGMCAGPFRLEPGERYEATLRLVDAAGNEAPAPGAPLALVGPVESPAPPKP